MIDLLRSQSAHALCLLLLVSVAAVTDLLSRRIPNWLIVGALIASLFLQVTGHAVADWAGGLLVGFALFLPGYVFRQMGAGDVKLMGAIGAFFGVAGAFKVVLAAYIMGGGFALFWVCLQRDRGAWLKYLVFRLRIGWLLVATRSGDPFRGCGLTDARPKSGAIPYAIPIGLAVVYALYMGW